MTGSEGGFYFDAPGRDGLGRHADVLAFRAAQWDEIAAKARADLAVDINEGDGVNAASYERHARMAADLAAKCRSDRDRALAELAELNELTKGN
jgi:hypothetical protein